MDLDMNNIKIQENNNWIENNYDIKDYIYFRYNDQILRFKLTLDKDSVELALFKIVNSLNSYEFEIKTEKQMKKYYDLIRFFPYAGKFRKEGNLFKTKNYYEPQRNPLFYMILDKYKNNLVTNCDFSKIKNALSDADLFGNEWINEVLPIIYSNLQVELKESYSLEEINNAVSIISKIAHIDSSRINDTLYSLKWILKSAEENVTCIEKLKIKDKFLESINDLDKPKVKTNKN